MATRTFDRVYVWEWPVRFTHWVNALAILVLIGSGFVMAWPPAVMTTADASASQWFGWVRLAHFIAAFVLFFAFALRMYWMFAGNRYARWENFLPTTSARLSAQVRQALEVLKVDIFMVRRAQHDTLGHNALAAWSYHVLFIVVLFQFATGFALYAPMSDFWLPQLFGWVTPLMGGDASVKLWHHVATWVFVLFILVHVHLSIYHDIVEDKGEISSIVSGSKFIDRQ